MGFVWLPGGVGVIYGIVASQGLLIQQSNDPFFGSVVSLMHVDGTDGQTTTTDQIATNTWSFFGNAQLDTAEKKFGTGALMLAAGDYISTPDKPVLNISSGKDYTIEAFVRLRALTRIHMIANKRSASGAQQFSFQVNQDGSLTLAEFNSVAVLVATSAASAIAVNTWYHVAFSKEGTTGRLFINGSLVATASQTGAVASNTAPLHIGRDGFATTRDWDGWIDDFRFTNGVARYTSAFTAPTAPFPNQGSSTPLVNEYLTAEEWNHDWANLTGWTTTGVQVSGNKLYGISGGNPCATAYPLSVAAGETLKMTIELDLTTSTSGLQYFGLNFGGANLGVNALLPNFCGIGSSGGSAVSWKGTQFIGGVASSTALNKSFSLGQVLKLDIVIDETNISLVIHSQNGAVEASRIIPRSDAPNGGVVTSLLVWNSATNGISGPGFKAVAFKRSLTPFRTKSNAAGVIEGQSAFVIHRASGAENWRFQLPIVQNGEVRTHLSTWFCQAGSADRKTPVDDTRWNGLRIGLDTNGYGLISVDDRNRWSNASSLSNYAAAAAWIRARHYSDEREFLIGTSMGGLAMLNTISRDTMGPVAAAVGICPVADLIWMRSPGGFAADIDAAWGSTSNATLETLADGYNPVTNTQSTFAGVPYKFILGASDTTVPPANHTDVLVPRLTGHALSTEVVYAGTGHLNVAQYDPNLIVPFFNTYK